MTMEYEWKWRHGEQESAYKPIIDTAMIEKINMLEKEVEALKKQMEELKTQLEACNHRLSKLLKEDELKSEI